MIVLAVMKNYETKLTDKEGRAGIFLEGHYSHVFIRKRGITLRGALLSEKGGALFPESRACMCRRSGFTPALRRNFI